jgi:hypothetical protein
MSKSDVRKTWDFFISYASEDREAAANPLTEALNRRGFAVWLDHKVISAGTDFSEQIRRGLTDSHYGIVIVSPRFLAKDWPMRELNTLLAIETVDGRHRVVAVFHDVTEAQVRNKAPELLDKAPIDTRHGFERVCDEVLERVVRATDREQRATLGELGTVGFPDFPGAGLVQCGNPNCSWLTRNDFPEDLKRQGPFFTLGRAHEQWCIICTSCGTPAGSISDEDAKEIAAQVLAGGLSIPTGRVQDKTR